MVMSMKQQKKHTHMKLKNVNGFPPSCTSAYEQVKNYNSKLVQTINFLIYFWSRNAFSCCGFFVGGKYIIIIKKQHRNRLK